MRTVDHVYSTRLDDDLGVRMNAIWEACKTETEDAAYPKGFIILDECGAEPFCRPDVTSEDAAGGS